MTGLIGREIKETIPVGSGRPDAERLAAAVHFDPHLILHFCLASH